MLSRVLKSLNAMVFAQLVARLGSLLLVPLFLSRWSPTLYGEWLTMSALVGYLATLDIGVQTAAVNRMTRSFARGELREYRECQHTALAVYIATAVIGTLLLILAVVFLPLPRSIGVHNTEPSTARLVLLLLGVSVLWSLPARLVYGTYQTVGNLAKSQWLWNIQQALSVAVIATILLRRGGMVSIALTQLALPAIVLGYAMLDIKLHLPQLFPGFKSACVSMSRQLFKPSVLFALLTFANLLVYQGNILLVSSTLGALSVALFSVTRTLTVLLRHVIEMLGTSLWPDLAGMEGRGEFDRLRRVHWILVTGSCVIAAALGATLWYEGASVITVWTRGRMQPDVVLLRLFVVYAVLQAPWIASAAIQVATNQHQQLALSYIGSAVCGVGLAAFLIRELGLIAIPISLAIGEAVACYHFVINRSCTLLHERYGAFAPHLWFGFAAVTAATMTAAAAVHHVVSGPAPVRWIIVAFISLAASALSAWIVWLRPQDRALLQTKFLLVVRPFTPTTRQTPDNACLASESAGSGRTRPGEQA